MTFIDERSGALVARERALLSSLAAFLRSFGADRSDTALIEQAAEDLEDLFLLVVVGEFNSGKSAFINALLRADVSEEGVTPTTDRITVLRYSAEPVERERRGGLTERGVPAELLRNLAIVDTPGTNAILRHHEELSRGFVPRSDLVLFVTSADRPFTESERGYLELIRDWGKKVLLVVNKADLLAGSADADRVRSFVEEGVRTLLGMTPPVFLVSARVARRAFQASSELERQALLQASGFEALETYIHDLLDERGRLRLKLGSPLGVAEQLSGRYFRAVRERTSLLEEDFRTVEQIDSDLMLYREDMVRDFSARLAELENIIHQMNERGDAWFEANIRLARTFELMSRDRIQARFQQEVVADSVSRIDERVQELIDWMVERNLKQWRAVTEYVARRSQTRYEDQLIGSVGAQFDYNRNELLQSVGRTTLQSVESYDRQHEARKIADSIQLAVTQTAVAEVGALGLGTAVAVLATATAVDVTGLLAAGTIAGLGLFVIPNRRRKARAEFRRRTETLREELSAAVSRQFSAELDRSIERIREAVAPYTRFVRLEHARMGEARETLGRIQSEVEAIRGELDLLTSESSASR